MNLAWTGKRLFVMQRTGCLDKNVLKNHKFTPNVSPDVYLPQPPPQNFDYFCGLLSWPPQIVLPPIIGSTHRELRHFVWFSDLATTNQPPSSPMNWTSWGTWTFCVDFRFAYWLLQSPSPESDLLIENLRHFVWTSNLTTSNYAAAPNWTFSWKILHGLQLVTGRLPSRYWVYFVHTFRTLHLIIRHGLMPCQNVFSKLVQCRRNNRSKYDWQYSRLSYVERIVGFAVFWCRWFLSAFRFFTKMVIIQTTKSVNLRSTTGIHKYKAFSGTSN